ncbi:MAG: GNAT family N-acetyltransferase, partial [Acidimicrobiales bacterium]
MASTGILKRSRWCSEPGRQRTRVCTSSRASTGPFSIAALRAAASEQRLALFTPGRTRAGGECVRDRSATTLSYSAPRFDPRFGWASPGHWILRAIVEHAFATELAEIDLLHGDLAYKREWSDGPYDLLRLMFSPSPALHAVHQAAIRAKAGGVRGLLGRSMT